MALKDDRPRSIQVGFIRYNESDDVLYFDTYQNEIVSSTIHHFDGIERFWCNKANYYIRTQFLICNLDAEIYELE